MSVYAKPLAMANPKQMELALRYAGHDRADTSEGRSDGCWIVHIDTEGASPVANLAATRLGPSLVPARNHDPVGEARREMGSDAATDKRRNHPRRGCHVPQP